MSARFVDQDMDANQVRSNSADQLHMSSSKNNTQRKSYCKKISKFIFSHVGLVTMVVIYAVAGAFLFELLEQHEEAKNCQEGKGQEATNIVNLKSTLLTYIQFNISTNPADTSKDNETVANQKIESWLTDFRDQVVSVSSTYRYTGQDCSSSKWNFAGSLLFAITVITTIGFGFIAPITWEGQIVCVCYATIGIPLFLMCIANISGVLGDMFRYVYSRICCRLCLKKKPKARAGQGVDENGDPIRADNAIADWNRTNTKSDKISTLDDEMNSSTTRADTAVGPPKVIDDKEDAIDDELNGDGGEDGESEERVTVPLTITMIIITLYILIGALIFNQFEGWTLIQSGYFCYITLATIGFGDFVPGQQPNDPYAGAKLILGAIYVLFGMAILAMCFDLMQEEIIAKFTWLGKKLGIIDKDADDEEEEADEANSAGAAAAANDEDKLKSDKKFDNEDTFKKSGSGGSAKKGGGAKKPPYVDDLANYTSPTPSYTAVAADEHNMSRLRSAYLQSVRQNK